MYLSLFEEFNAEKITNLYKVKERSLVSNFENNHWEKFEYPSNENMNSVLKFWDKIKQIDIVLKANKRRNSESKSKRGEEYNL